MEIGEIKRKGIKLSLMFKGNKFRVNCIVLNVVMRSMIAAHDFYSHSHEIKKNVLTFDFSFTFSQINSMTLFVWI